MLIVNGQNSLLVILTVVNCICMYAIITFCGIEFNYTICVLINRTKALN